VLVSDCFKVKINKKPDLKRKEKQNSTTYNSQSSVIINFFHHYCNIGKLP
jgi:hypothetical protein